MQENKIIEIIQKSEKEFEKLISCSTEDSEGKINPSYDYPADIKSHIKKGNISLIEAMIKEIEGKERKRYSNKDFLAHRDEDNQIYNQALTDLTKLLKETLKEI